MPTLKFNKENKYQSPQKSLGISYAYFCEFLKQKGGTLTPAHAQFEEIIKVFQNTETMSISIDGEWPLLDVSSDFARDILGIISLQKSITVDGLIEEVGLLPIGKNGHAPIALSKVKTIVEHLISFDYVKNTDQTGVSQELLLTPPPFEITERGKLYLEKVHAKKFHLV